MSESASPLLGQRAAVRAFGAALARDRVHHAWILHGPMGVGKMLAARLFAGLVLDPDTRPEHRAAFAPPRGTDEARLLDAGTHPDFLVIRKELARHSANRELRERKQLNIPLDLLRETLLGGTDGEGRHHDAAAFRTSTRGQGKVFVIDEAELLEAEAQNALLKTLEEPPGGALLILVAADVDALLPTIRSRCQEFTLRPLPHLALAVALQEDAGLNATGVVGVDTWSALEKTVERGGLRDLLRGEINREAEHARHRGDGHPLALPVDHEHRPDEVRRRQHVLQKQKPVAMKLLDPARQRVLGGLCRRRRLRDGRSFLILIFSGSRHGVRD